MQRSISYPVGSVFAKEFAIKIYYFLFQCGTCGNYFENTSRLKGIRYGPISYKTYVDITNLVRVIAWIIGKSQNLSCSRIKRNDRNSLRLICRYYIFYLALDNVLDNLIHSKNEAIPIACGQGVCFERNDFPLFRIS